MNQYITMIVSCYIGTLRYINGTDRVLKIATLCAKGANILSKSLDHFYIYNIQD